MLDQSFSDSNFNLIFLIFKFLNLLWSYETFIPYLATLLFAVHPVHTEVIANLKSRDEIFSLIFIFNQGSINKFPATQEEMLTFPFGLSKIGFF